MQRQPTRAIQIQKFLRKIPLAVCRTLSFLPALFPIIAGLFVSSSAFSALPPSAHDPQYDEFEGVALAHALLRDGHLDAATEVLAQVSSVEKQAQNARFHRLQGEIHLIRGHVKEALESLATAIKAPQTPEPNRQDGTRGEAFLFYGEAHFRDRNFAACAAAFAAARGALYASEKSDTWVLRKAACEARIGRRGNAYVTLLSGEHRLGGLALFRERVILMKEMGLRREALRQSLERLETPTLKSADVLGVAEVLGEDGLEFLEVARLRFPGDADLHLAAVPLLHERGLLHATAQAFERAAQKIPKYLYHAAEIHRQLGHLQLAYWLNVRVPDDTERFRQRLAILVETQRWDLIAALESNMRRERAKVDDEAQYALGFSLAQLGRGDLAKNHLATITTPGLVPKATALAKSIYDCEKLGWACR